jgi:hypothetical protein
MKPLKINEKYSINLDGLKQVNYRIDIGASSASGRIITLTFSFVDGTERSFNSSTDATETELFQAHHNIHQN